jgi:hypothetical protein
MIILLLGFREAAIRSAVDRAAVVRSDEADAFGFFVCDMTAWVPFRKFRAEIQEN